ncbi:MAG: hypothetical protein J7521_18615 [Caulobacter sp.]|nr:hypothetical protein [Caulobacter sp.]
MTEDSLIASHVYSRRLDKPPTTWPAFVAAAVVAASLTIGYSIGFLGLREEAFDLSDLINSRFLFSIVPCGVISLGVWTLLYVGFLRWRAPTMGPIYFNLLAVIVFGTSLLAPVVMHGVRHVEFQVAQAKMREAWKQAPALKGDLALIARNARQADIAAWDAISLEIREADAFTDLSPSVLDSQATVDKRRARIAKAAKDLEAYNADYGRRLQATRQAVLEALVRNKAGPLVVERVRPLVEDDTRNALARRAGAYETRQTVYAEALDVLDILAKARGSWESQGSRMIFYQPGVADRLVPEFNEASRIRNRLRYLDDKVSSPMLWSRPPPGV